MVSIPNKPQNHPIYSVDTNLGTFVFYNELCLEEEEQGDSESNQQDKHKQEELDGLWSMRFDGAVNREGAGAGVQINPPEDEGMLHSFKLDFDCTNNEAEYEALLLGLNLLKDKGVKRIVVQGDSELVINHAKGIYQAKHPRMIAYQNVVLDLIENFTEVDFSHIPRRQNTIVDSLAASASTFKIPISPNTKHVIEVKHRPTVSDNVEHWQVFQDDEQIKDFLQLKGEFQNLHIDKASDKKGDNSSAPVFKTEGYLNTLAGKDILQLKNNTIPRGLVPLEKLFDNNDVAANPKLTPEEGEMEDFNIGTDKHPSLLSYQNP